MHTSTWLTLPALAVLASAQAQDTNGILASISELQASLVPPPSIASVLKASAPESVNAAATNLESLAAVHKEFETGVPTWYPGLPDDVKAYLVSFAATAEQITPQIQSLSSQAIAEGLIVVTTTEVHNATTLPATVTSSSNSASASASGNSSSSASDDKKSSSSSSATSTGAPQTTPTAASAPRSADALAMGLAGVVAFAGMLVML